jgi:hypothetical protein
MGRQAIRYEPAFRTRYVAPLGLPPTEEVARSISWGLMQVMGQVAREHGFAGKFLSALCDGPRHRLRRPRGQALRGGRRPFSQARFAVDLEPFLDHALALWNGGANPDFAAHVLARIGEYK